MVKYHPSSSRPRSVLAWRLSNTMDVAFCLPALEAALARYGKPESVGWQHINLTGDYLWDVDIGLAPDGFRALRTTATSLRPAIAA